MNAEQLRLVVAVCLVTVSSVFCGLGTVKIMNDSSIARDTKRVADALERAHPSELVTTPLVAGACETAVPMAR